MSNLECYQSHMEKTNIRHYDLRLNVSWLNTNALFLCKLKKRIRRTKILGKNPVHIYINVACSLFFHFYQHRLYSEDWCRIINLFYNKYIRDPTVWLLEIKCEILVGNTQDPSKLRFYEEKPKNRRN